jgi:hypothetical protein
MDDGEVPLEVSLDQPGPESCSSIRAFDSTSSTSLVSRENRIDFTPRILELFDRLSKAQKDVEARIRSRIERLEAQEPDLRDFESRTSISEALGALSAETDFSEIQSLATFSEADSDEHSKLKEQLAISKTSSEELAAAKDRGRAEIEQTVELINRIVGLVSDESVGERRSIKQDADERSKAAAAVEARAFGDAPLPDLSPDLWREMWVSAERYIQSGVSKHPFPPGNPDEKCPLCYQELDPDAKVRFDAFQDFLKDETARAASSARDSYSASVAALEAPLPSVGGDTLDRICSDDVELREQLDSLLARADERLTALRDNPTEYPGIPLPESPSRALMAKAAVLGDEAESLRTGFDDEEYQNNLRRKLELEQRSSLKVRIEEFQKWHACLCQIAKCEAAIKKLGTRPLTTKHGLLSEEVIDGTFREVLQSELDAMRLSHLRVDFVSRGSQGTRNIEIVLPDAVQAISITEVLSEGEQRAIALAAFLAGLAPEGSNGPLVIDDPVSSFDQDRRTLVAHRLVREAAKRQVIVFTHDIAFVFALKSQGKDQGASPKVVALAQRGDTFGHVEPDGPSELRNVRNTCDYLESNLTQFPEEGSADEQIAFAKQWYGVLREGWERAVELHALKGVVQRFERGVMTGALSKVDLSPELVTQVDEGMSHCSIYVHSSPPPDPLPAPTKQEMASHAGALRRFIKSVKR